MPAPEWKKLDPEALALLRRRLAQDFIGFAEFCETTGLLRNNFLEIDNLARTSSHVYDPNHVCSMCAAAVVSAANHFGGMGETEQARQLASWALLLEPICVPAMLCLVACATAEGRQDEIAVLQQRVTRIYQELRSKPRQQLSAYEAGLIHAGEGLFGP